MENKKLPELTDEQIMKALECCSQEDKCQECPYGAACLDEKYVSNVSRDALVVIKRLKAENKGLNNQLDYWRDDAFKNCLSRGALAKYAKASAIKELLLRAKGLEQIIGEDNELKPYILVEDLNRIAKEMTGDKKRGIE